MLSEPEQTNLISLKEIAAQFNISAATVNYYTNMGLINIVKKAGNKRFYEKQAVTSRINRIREFMNKGYTLRLIQQEFLKVQTL